MARQEIYGYLLTHHAISALDLPGRRRGQHRLGAGRGLRSRTHCRCFPGLRLSCYTRAGTHGCAPCRCRQNRVEA